MVLKANTPAPAVAAAPAAAAAPGGFETDTATPTQQAAAAVGANTAIAKAKTSAMAVTAGKVDSVFDGYKMQKAPVEFGEIPRLIASPAGILDGDGNKYGSWVEFTLAAWNDLYVISPGSDTAEARGFVRYSNDGETIDDTGESVSAYLENLRTVEGYPDASRKLYAELVGIVEKSEKDVGKAGVLVQVSLSPQARKLFTGLGKQQAVYVRMGRAPVEGSEKLMIRSEGRSMNGKNFAILAISARA